MFSESFTLALVFIKSGGNIFLVGEGFCFCIILNITLGFGCVVKEFGLFLIFEFENLDEAYVVLLFGNLIVFVFIII